MKVKSTVKDRDSELLARRATQVQKGAARAAVLGVNDGLVSTVCLVLGVAAATGGSQHAVLVAGFAGLVAGAFSMAAGEWISVKAQVDLFEGILSDLKKLVNRDLPLLRDNLENKFIASGMSIKNASLAARDVAKKDTHFAEQYAVQVLGVNPEELGSPWQAGFSSFALFTLGSLVALSPWFFVGSQLAVILSVIFTGVLSLGVGMYIAKSSGKRIFFGAFRQFLIVVAASVVTYGIGHVFGIAIG